MNQVKVELENGVNLVKDDFNVGMLSIAVFMKQDKELQQSRILLLNQKDEEISDLRIRFITIEQNLALEKQILNQQIENLSVNTEALILCHTNELSSLKVQLGKNEEESKTAFDQNNDLKITLKSLQLDYDMSLERIESLQITLDKMTVQNNLNVASHELEKAYVLNEILLENQNMKVKLEEYRKEFLSISEQIVQNNEKCDRLSIEIAFKESSLQKEIHLKEEAIRKELSLKEKSLRFDLKNSNSHKHEVESRLMSIQEKVKLIELEHEIFITDLKAKLQESEANCIVFQNQKLRMTVMNNELSDRMNELVLNNNKSKGQLDKQKNRNSALENDTNNQIQKIANELKVYKKNYAELESSRDALRSDVKEMENINRMYSKQIDEKDLNLNEIIQEKILLQSVVDKFHTTQNNNESKELKKSLLLAQQTASDREKEVFNLKETIRRECEERIENMIEIDHLKEKIMRHDELKNNKDYNKKNVHDNLSSSQSVSGHRDVQSNDSNDMNDINKPKQRSSSAVTLIEQQQINSEKENNSWTNQMMKKKHHPTRKKNI